jgi:hyperosmotically inducible periplasmic protein
MTSRFAMGVVVLGLAVAPLAGYAADKATEKKEGMIPRVKEITDDSTITGKIKADFAKDKAVSALGINVDTNKGVVTLSGNAKSKEEADKAVAIAKNTGGVSSVKNEIKVSSSSKK